MGRAICYIFFVQNSIGFKINNQMLKKGPVPKDLDFGTTAVACIKYKQLTQLQRTIEGD